MGLTQTWNLMDMLLRKRKLLEKIKKKKPGQQKKYLAGLRDWKMG